MKTTQQSISMSSNPFASNDASAKFQGFIETPIRIELRRALFSLFTYCSFASSPYFLLHAIVSWLRVVQFVGPALCANFIDIWGVGSTMSMATNILSITFHLIPGFARRYCDLLVIYIYVVISWLFNFLVLWAAKKFKATAELPKIIPTTIVIYYGTLGYLMHPVAINLAAEILGLAFYDKKYIQVKYILAVVLVLITFAYYFYIFNRIYSVTITFRPDSLMTIVPSVQSNLLLVTNLVTFTMGVASQIQLMPKLVISVITAVGYTVSLTVIFSKGGLVSIAHMKAVAASAVSGSILILIGIFLELAGIIANEYVLIGCVGVWILMFFLFNFYFDYVANRSLSILDQISAEEMDFAVIKSPRKLCEIAVNGFRYAHPICLDWRIFQLATERWPKEIDIWVLFAKFSAIYPEETQKLSWIGKTMVMERLKGSLAKNTESQINSVLLMREINLIPQLKTKLDKVAKQVSSTKHKMRHVWDQAIQGNTADLESCIDKAQKAVDTVDAEFLHLISTFPNSRYVARNYSRFLRDIKADHEGYKKWSNNASQLQKRIQVIPDQPHELGIRAFPFLPSTVNSDFQLATAGMLTEDTMTQDLEVDEEVEDSDYNMRSSIKEAINRLRIPAFRNTQVLFISITLILFVLPAIIIAIVIPNFVKQSSEPLSYIYVLSCIRTRMFQLISIGLHLIFEKNNLFEGTIDDGTLPVYLGSTLDSIEQIKYLVNQMLEYVKNLNGLNNYETGNKKLDEVKRLTFVNGIEFVYVITADRVEWKDLSITTAISEFAVLFRDLISLSDFSPSTIADSKYTLIPLANVENVTDAISNCLLNFRTFITESYAETKIIVYSAVGSAVGVIVVLFIILTWYSIHKINEQKSTIYKCIISLPKNVVWKIADSFKVIKKDSSTQTNKTRDEEYNKQEENMIKIFVTSSDTIGSKASETNAVSILSFIICGLFVGAVFVIALFIENTSAVMSNNCPHIDILMAAYSYDLASMISVFMIGAMYDDYGNGTGNFVVPGFTDKYWITLFNKFQTKGSDSYTTSQYGKGAQGILPFQGTLSLSFPSSSSPSCDDMASPMDQHDIYMCWSGDLISSYVKFIVSDLINSYQADNNTYKVDLHDNIFTQIWHIYQIHLYNSYFAPMYDQIVSIIYSLMSADTTQDILIVVLLSVIAVLFSIIISLIIGASEKRQKFAMKLFLFCPGSVIHSNSNIVSILAGNFDSTSVSMTNRDEEFYQDVVNDLPDAIVTLSSDFTIKTANKAIKRIFGIEPDTVIGTKIMEFGQCFDENPLSDIEAQNSESKTFEKVGIIKRENDTDIHINIIFEELSDAYVVSFRDITQSVMYNRLINDEQQKTDTLLASILPAKLVPRVQAGEKNISFSIQSATVLFLDIVSFTPWCGSNEASYVMSTLNRMFKDFDHILSTHPTMTKIKCIGDCYMAAGGLFMDVNQPTIHAKDVVEFGLEVIEALEKINEEIGESLRIRVGVNTGGPLVAGVLGTGKPTFEILGPTINMAQQMEHHGVPMKVHVSRATYELIYGGNFNVKERGEIEIKQGTTVTYVVTRK